LLEDIETNFTSVQCVVNFFVAVSSMTPSILTKFTPLISKGYRFNSAFYRIRNIASARHSLSRVDSALTSRGKEMRIHERFAKEHGNIMI